MGRQWFHQMEKLLILWNHIYLTTVYCVTKITQIRILDNKLFRMIKSPSASHQYNIKQSKGHRLNFQEHLFYIEEL